MNTRSSFFTRRLAQKIRNGALRFLEIFERVLQYLFGEGLLKGVLIIFFILSLFFFGQVILFEIKSSGLGDIFQKFYYFFFPLAR